MSDTCVPTPLTGTQLQAIGALLAGRSPAEAARDCGIAPRTLRAWQSQPGFRAALLEGQSRLLQQLSLQLATAASDAVRTLVTISQDTNQKGSVRVAAAVKLLDFFFRAAPQAAASLAAGVGEGAAVGEAAPIPQPSETSTMSERSRLFAAAFAAAPSSPTPALLEPGPELTALPSELIEPPLVARGLPEALRLPRPNPARPFAPSTRTSDDPRSVPSLATRIPTGVAIRHAR